MVYMVIREGVLWSWCGVLELHCFLGVGGWRQIKVEPPSTGMLWASETQGRSSGGAAGKVSDFKAFERRLASSAIVRWAPSNGLGVCNGEKPAWCPQGYEGQGPFEVSTVATLWLRWPSRIPTLLPHITYGHLQKLTPGTTVAPRLKRCNLRVAVAACQTMDRASSLVQTGSKRDPLKPHRVKYPS